MRKRMKVKYTNKPIGKIKVTTDFLPLPDELKVIHHPKHPGLLVQSLCLDPLSLSVTVAAKALKVARPTLSKLLHGHIGISPEMAIRLSIVFNTSAKLWVDMQAGYDLWQAQQHAKRLRLKPFTPRKNAA